MSQQEETQTQPQRKSRRVRTWGFAAFIAIIGIGWIFLNFGGNSERVVPDISRETTAILEPVTDAGLIDYVAAVNQRASKGVTPEDNFELVVRSVMGTEAIAGYEEEYSRLLGIDSVPTASTTFISYDLFLTDGDPAKQPSSSAVFNKEDYWNATGRIWTAEEFPNLANWVEKNNTVFDELVQGSMRTRDYSPYLVRLEVDRNEASLVDVILPWIEERRLLSSALAVRATLKGGRGDHKSAWKDLQAVHRISRLTAQSLSPIERLSIFAIEQMALRGDIAILSAPDLDADTLRERGEQLLTMSSLPTMRETVETYSRWRCLDFLLTAYYLPEKTLQGPNKGIARARNVASSLSRKELNQSLKWTNEQYDRLVSLFDIEDPIKRRNASEAFREEIEEMLQSRKANAFLLSLFSSKAAWHAETVRNLAYAEMAIDANTLSNSQPRLETLRRMAAVAYFVVEYQRRHGEYPADLNQLIPDRIDQIPEDLCMGQPLFYTRLPGGFLLHSRGTNQTDDVKIDLQNPKIPESVRDDLVIILLDGQAQLVTKW